MDTRRRTESKPVARAWAIREGEKRLLMCRWSEETVRDDSKALKERQGPRPKARNLQSSQALPPKAQRQVQP